MSNRKTILWLYDEARPYPSAQITHVRQSLLVDLLPVSSTFQAITALQSTEPGHITHIVTCLARTEFGQPLPYAGLDLIKTVRLHNRAIPIALFSAVALSTPQLTAQTFAAAGVAGPQRNFDISSNTNDLITFLSRSGIPRRLAAATICLPTTGDRVISDQTQMEYTIGNKLGEGAYAWVYECSDFFNQRLVAKVQKPQRAKKTVEDDWKKEQSFMQTVNHPNVITLYDTFVYNNLYFYILERADGTLRNHIPASGGGMAMELVLELVPQILSGLTHIHQKRIVHRDLQIDNILLKHGPNNTIIAKISDFGISKLLSGAECEVQGTTGRPLDVAPELLSNGITTFLSDIYQLGLVFYQLHTGQHAVTGERVIDESVTAARKVARPDLYEAIKLGVPSQRAMAIGTPFGRCVARMLAVQPKDRYQSTLEVWTDIYFSCIAPLVQPVALQAAPAQPVPVTPVPSAPAPSVPPVPSVPPTVGAPPPVPDRTGSGHVLSTPAIIQGVSHFTPNAEDAIPASD